jgi:hypothetical protein
VAGFRTSRRGVVNLEPEDDLSPRRERWRRSEPREQDGHQTQTVPVPVLLWPSWWRRGAATRQGAHIGVKRQLVKTEARGDTVRRGNPGRGQAFCVGSLLREASVDTRLSGRSLKQVPCYWRSCERWARKAIGRPCKAAPGGCSTLSWLHRSPWRVVFHLKPRL